MKKIDRVVRDMEKHRCIVWSRKRHDDYPFVYICVICSFTNNENQISALQSIFFDSK